MQVCEKIGINPKEEAFIASFSNPKYLPSSDQKFHHIFMVNSLFVKGLTNTGNEIC